MRADRERRPLACRAVHLRRRDRQWAWITAFFDSVEQRIGDEARLAEGVAEHEHGERRVHVGLAGPHQPQVVAAC